MGQVSYSTSNTLLCSLFKVRVIREKNNLSNTQEARQERYGLKISIGVAFGSGNTRSCPICLSTGTTKTTYPLRLGPQRRQQNETKAGSFSALRERPPLASFFLDRTAPSKTCGVEAFRTSSGANSIRAVSGTN